MEVKSSVLQIFFEDCPVLLNVSTVDLCVSIVWLHLTISTEYVILHSEVKRAQVVFQVTTSKSKDGITY